MVNEGFICLQLYYFLPFLVRTIAGAWRRQKSPDYQITDEEKKKQHRINCNICNYGFNSFVYEIILFVHNVYSASKS